MGGVYITGIVGGVETLHRVGIKALWCAVHEAQLRTVGVVQENGWGNQVFVLICYRSDVEAAEAAVDQRLPFVTSASLAPTFVESIGVVDTEDGLPFHRDGKSSQIARIVDDDLHVVVVAGEDTGNLTGANGQRLVGEGCVVAGSQCDGGTVSHLDVVAGGRVRVCECGYSAFHESGAY